MSIDVKLEIIFNLFSSKSRGCLYSRGCLNSNKYGTFNGRNWFGAAPDEKKYVSWEETVENDP